MNDITTASWTQQRWSALPARSLTGWSAGVRQPRAFFRNKKTLFRAKTAGVGCKILSPAPKTIPEPIDGLRPPRAPTRFDILCLIVWWTALAHVVINFSDKLCSGLSGLPQCIGLFWLWTVWPLHTQTIKQLHRHVASPNDGVCFRWRLHLKHLVLVHTVALRLFTTAFCIPP